jgi:hypothetical protein
MSERPMWPVRRRPMVPVLSGTGRPDANNTPRDVSVSLTNAEYEALCYLVDYCASEPYFGHGCRDRQALADACVALDALRDGLGLS